jgi:hypothetical protein
MEQEPTGKDIYRTLLLCLSICFAIAGLIVPTAALILHNTSQHGVLLLSGLLCIGTLLILQSFSTYQWSKKWRLYLCWVAA